MEFNDPPKYNENRNLEDFRDRMEQEVP